MRLSIFWEIGKWYGSTALLGKSRSHMKRMGGSGKWRYMSRSCEGGGRTASWGRIPGVWIMLCVTVPDSVLSQFSGDSSGWNGPSRITNALANLDLDLDLDLDLRRIIHFIPKYYVPWCS